MSRYVLTGASGHIGNNLVRLINSEEPTSEIICLTRRPVERELAGTVCRQVVGDLSDPAFLQENIGEGDTVVHLACLIDLSGKKKDESFAINYTLTRSIADHCLKTGVHRLIYTGSVDGIARNNTDSVLREPETFLPSQIPDIYGKTKAMAMNYVWDMMKKYPDFPCSMVLPSAVIGIHDYKPSAIGRVIRDVLSGGAQFGIKGGYNFVDVRDVVSAIYTLCHEDLRDMFILSGHSVTVKELYQWIDREAGIQRRVITVPLFLVKAVMPFIKVLNKTTIKALTDSHRFSYKRARDAFGYEPLPLETTMHDTVVWFMENESALASDAKA